MTDVLEQIKTHVIESIPNFLASTVFFLIGMIFLKLLRRFIIKVTNKINTTDVVRNFIVNIINVSLIASLVIISLSMLGVPVATFAAIFGAIGVGISIVFKESLANLGAGFLLIFITKPFKADDYIAVSSSEGKVAGINLFSTALKTIDNKTIMIPNSKLLNESIINYSNEQLRRLDINFYVEHDTDFNKLKKVIRLTLEKEKRVLIDPAPTIGIKKITPLGLNIIIAPWVRAEDYWDTYYDLIGNLKLNLDRNNVNITSTYKNK